jgi:ankyrin repeat protein
MSAEEDIIEAAAGGDANRTRALVAADRRLANATGDYEKSPLHLAAEHDHVETARALVAAGASLAARTSWGMTPLQWAANMGSRGVAEVLVAAGASLDLWSAAGLGRLDEVKSFWATETTLKDDAAPPRHDEIAADQWVQLPPSTDYHDIVSDAAHIACRNGHVEVAAFLLEKGADIDRPGFFGGSGLHWAAINGHAEMVAFLVARGARLDARDRRFDSTPEEWATEGGHDDIVDLLRTAGVG